MTILKCKMCGGDIEATGATHGICQYCGLEITLPKIDDEIRGEFFNRANYFRAHGEFDKAYSEFEHIIAGDPTDAEAYWSLVLCRYGITYEQNPQTGEFEIIVNTMRREPVFENIDYRKALENSDEYTKTLYRDEAKRIDEIQEQYFSVVRKTEPYDVFVCVNDMEGKTDSKARVIAETIKDKLAEKSLRVFVGINSDKYKSRTEYEAHVYHALESAKIMFAVSAVKDDLLDVSVRNQWTRFLNIIKEDRSKKIVPVYSSIDMYDIPEQIPTHEAICADDQGYWQDLTRGVLALLGRLDAPKNAANPATEFLRQAKLAFEAGNYLKAELMADQALTHEPENGDGYYYFLLSKNKVGDFNSLLNVTNDWKNDSALKGLISHGNSDQKKAAQDFLIEYTNRTNYNTAKKLMEREEYVKAISLLQEIVGYRDSSEVLEHCKKLAYHQKQWRDFNAEVNGDSKYHVYNKINKERGDVIGTVRGMVKKIVEAPRAQFEPYKALIVAIIFLACGVICFLGEKVFSGPGEMYLSMAMVVQLITTTIYCKFVKGSPWISLCFVLPFVLVFSIFPYGIGSIIMALLPANRFKKERKKEKKYARYVSDLDYYTNNTVTPLENQIIMDIYNRYESLSEEEIGEFYGIVPLISNELGYYRYGY